jgi:hypothetical protein
MKHLLSILFLAGVCHASVLQMDLNGYPLDVELSTTLPDQFAYAVMGTTIQHADFASIIGGGYPTGLVILPPINAVASASGPWSFELLASNPAIWQIDIAGDPTTAWPDQWVSVGTVVTGHDYLLSLQSSSVVTYAGETSGPILFVPEPTTLAVMVGALALPMRTR